MGRKVWLEELSFVVVTGVVRAATRRARSYPAPFGEEIAWEVEATADAGGASDLLRDFLATARLAEQSSRGGDKPIHHRLVLPRGAQLDALVMAVPELPSILLGDPPSGVAVVCQAVTPTWPCADLGFPIRVEVLGTKEAVEETLRAASEDAVIAEALKRGILAFHGRPVEGHRARYPEPASERSVVHLCASGRSPRADVLLESLWHLRPSPWLLVVEEKVSVPNLAEYAVAAGSAAMIAAWPPVKPGAFAASLYRQLLHDLPLDIALMEATRSLNVGGCAAIALAEGATASGLLSRALLVHHERGCGRLIDAFDPPRWPAPSPGHELGQFLAHRATAARKRVLGVGQKTAAIVHESPLEALEELCGALPALTKALAAWRRAQDVANAVIGEERFSRRGLRGPPESLGGGDEVRPGPRLQRRPTPRLPDTLPKARELPARLTHVWVTEQDRAAPIPSSTALALGVRYHLWVQIGFDRRDLGAPHAFPIEDLWNAFDECDEVSLDVLVFARKDEVALCSDRATLRLSRFGESDEARFSFTLLVPDAVSPDGSGTGKPSGASNGPHRRVRVGIYHANRLLQSVAIDLAIADGHVSRNVLDFLATDQLLLIDDLPPASASFFVDDGPGGAPCIGIAGLTRPALLDISPQQVKALVARSQNDGDPPSSHLKQLAWPGEEVWRGMFLDQEGLALDQKAELSQVLQAHGGVLEIARVS